jgi:hypothetical protein
LFNEPKNNVSYIKDKRDYNLRARTGLCPFLTWIMGANINPKSSNSQQREEDTYYEREIRLTINPPTHIPYTAFRSHRP